MPYLVVVQSGTRGVVHPLGAEPCRIGRDLACAIPLADEAASRHHAEIAIDPRGFALCDLDSRHGTFVNGLPVRRHELRDGDEIRIGACLLRFVHDVPGAAQPTGATRRTGAEGEDAVLAGGMLLGRSDAMGRVVRMVRKAAATDAPVLVLGETGTGKELVARAIHANSPRAAGPFEVVNCAAIPETLIESELFGHEAGAFTGATAPRVGSFEAAHGGTLLLDEAGELSAAAQAKLLRAVETGEVTRLGSSAPRRACARIVAATHRDLRAEIERGRFRRDLYYRLRVVVIELPRLADRRDDVPLLADHFLRQCALRWGRPARRFTEAALAKLAAYPWPGNVRELRHAVEAACVLADGEAIDAADLPLEVRALAQSDAERLEDLRSVERRTIVRVLRAVGGNKSEAARILGIDRKTLRHKVETLAIRDAEVGA